MMRVCGKCECTHRRRAYEVQLACLGSRQPAKSQIDSLPLSFLRLHWTVPNFLREAAQRDGLECFCVGPGKRACRAMRRSTRP